MYDITVNVVFTLTHLYVCLWLGAPIKHIRDILLNKQYCHQAKYSDYINTYIILLSEDKI